jgi:hypothetical protein
VRSDEKNFYSERTVDSARATASDLEPLASTVEMSAPTAGRWAVRGLVSRTRSIVPSSGSRCAGPRVASWVGTTMANAYVQLAVDPDLRGRVMGLYMLVFAG